METPIIDGLEKYISENKKPWHMPGHKRKCDKAVTSNVVEAVVEQAKLIDMTEVPGVDDLHAPEEMIARSQEQLATVYDTFASYYLVNGSTCGIFAALAACARGGLIAMDNCHKSVHNAADVMEIPVYYVSTRRENSRNELEGADTEVPASIRVSADMNELRSLCEEHPEATAIIVTTPTYEGVIFDINAISLIVKEFGKWIIVDEAHGAHLPFMQRELSAISNGADVVIQSLHKTLEAFTQTAILHVVGRKNEERSDCGEDCNRDVRKNVIELDSQIKKYLTYFMSSSPSYIFMASMERAIAKAVANDFSDYRENLKAFRGKCAGLKNIAILSPEAAHNIGAYAYDETRIVLYAKDKSKAVTGVYLEQALAAKGIVCEMSGVDYVVLISTYVDEKSDFEDLFDALYKVDEAFEDKRCMSNCGDNLRQKLDIKIGYIAEEDIYVYPPGIPLVRRGESITKERLEELEQVLSSGKRLRGI